MSKPGFSREWERRREALKDTILDWVWRWGTGLGLLARWRISFGQVAGRRRLGLWAWPVENREAHWGLSLPRGEEGEEWASWAVGPGIVALDSCDLNEFYFIFLLE